MEDKELSESYKEQQIDKVEPRHRAMMRLQISGYRTAELAEVFGLQPLRISQIINSPLYKEELARMEEEVNKEFAKSEGEKTRLDFIRIRMKDEASKSLDKLIALRDGASSERVQQLSAMDILDRAGVVKTNRVEGELVIDASEGLVGALEEAVKEMREKSVSK